MSGRFAALGGFLQYIERHEFDVEAAFAVTDARSIARGSGSSVYNRTLPVPPRHISGRSRPELPTHWYRFLLSNSLKLISCSIFPTPGPPMLSSIVFQTLTRQCWTRAFEPRFYVLDVQSVLGFCSYQYNKKPCSLCWWRSLNAPWRMSEAKNC